MNPFHSLVQRAYHGLIPEPVRAAIRTAIILNRDYGQYRSFAEGRAVDRAGEPLPWFSYPAIFQLSQYDLSSCSVLEFGSGQSTLYWSRCSRQVVSIETDRGWYERLKPNIPANVRLLYYDPRDSESCFRHIQDLGRLWDIIVIDGSWRASCARLLPPLLSPGGLVILDNPDWYPRAASNLREQDFIETLFSGFCPALAHTTATAFYFPKNFRFKSRGREALLRIPGSRGVLHETPED